MEVAALGDLCVTVQGRDRTPGGQRSRDLLVALVLRRDQSVDASVLLDQVWGEESAGLTVAVVHTQVARLRKAVGDEHVLTTVGGYRVAGADVDTDRFTELLGQARSADPSASVVLLRDALSLWRGDVAYANVSEDLVAAESSRLHAVRVDALELLAERLVERGDSASLEEALALARELVAREPLREHGHELGMRAATAAGRRAEALAWFDRLRVTLRDELGIDPGPGPRRLHLELLREEPVPSAEIVAAATSAPPAPTTRTIGRDDDLAVLRDLVAGRRLVTVTGLGGVGKTRVLGELYGVLDPEAACAYVDLSGFDGATVEELVEAVGQALGLGLSGGDVLESLVLSLGGREVVLLVDEAERSIGELARLVELMLKRCAGLTVVVTSRRPLGLVGEAVHVLAPLTVPGGADDATTSLRSPAVRLLRERIQDRAPDLVGDEAALLRLRDFARRVDGLPLALELLAAQSHTRSLDELAELLDVPLALSSDDAGLAERHRTLHSTIAWSVDRLPPPLALVLTRLSVFAGRFDVDAARAVAGPGEHIDAAVRALVRDALVHVERTPQRLEFRLLRPVRDLARERLEATGRHEAVAARHRRWHAEKWRGAQRSDAMLVDVREHYADYLQALRGALETDDQETAGDLVLTLGRLWNYTEMLVPCLRWTDRALGSGLLSPLATAQVTVLRDTLRLWKAPLEVRADLEVAIPVLEAHEDTATLTTAHGLASFELSLSGEHERAVEHARSAVSAARRSGEDRTADALGMLAVTAATSSLPGTADEAEAAAKEAWDLVNRGGSAFAVAYVATNLSWAHFALDRPEVSADLLARAQTRLAPDELPLFFRFALAWSRLLTGDPVGALTEFARVVAVNTESLEDRKSAEVYLGCAVALVECHDPVAAELLAGAQGVIARTELQLAPWLRRLEERAVDSLRDAEPAPWGADVATGERLADLVAEAARRLTTPPYDGDRSIAS